MTPQIAAGLLMFALTWHLLTKRARRWSRFANVLDAFAVTVDQQVTRRIVSWLARFVRKP